MVTEGKIQSPLSCMSLPVLIATWSVFASPNTPSPHIFLMSRSLWWLWRWRPWRQTESSNPFPHEPLKVVPSRMTNANIAAPNQFHQTPFSPITSVPTFYCPWALCPPSTPGHMSAAQQTASEEASRFLSMSWLRHHEPCETRKIPCNIYKAL